MELTPVPNHAICRDVQVPQIRLKDVTPHSFERSAALAGSSVDGASV